MMNLKSLLLLNHRDHQKERATIQVEELKYQEPQDSKLGDEGYQKNQSLHHFLGVLKDCLARTIYGLMQYKEMEKLQNKAVKEPELQRWLTEWATYGEQFAEGVPEGMLLGLERERGKRILLSLIHLTDQDGGIDRLVLNGSQLQHEKICICKWKLYFLQAVPKVMS